jgi:hypothetical protein
VAKAAQHLAEHRMNKFLRYSRDYYYFCAVKYLAFCYCTVTLSILAVGIVAAIDCVIQCVKSHGEYRQL